MEAQDQPSTATKSKTDIFSPRSPVYRTPLTSRRSNGNNLPANQQRVPGLILPQAPYLGSLQQQHLQRNGVSLYSPRGKASMHTALQGQFPASAFSPRQARRTVSKDHNNLNKGLNGTAPPSNLTKPVAHAAAAAGRPAVAPLRHQTSQQQSQLYSPRRYVVPAPLEGLSPRAALHCHHTGGAGSHAQPASGSSTWRGPLNSHRVSQQLSQQQSLQSSTSILPASRLALHTALHLSDLTHVLVIDIWIGIDAYGKHGHECRCNPITERGSCQKLLLDLSSLSGRGLEKLHVNPLNMHVDNLHACAARCKCSLCYLPPVALHCLHGVSLVSVHTSTRICMSRTFLLKPKTSANALAASRFAICCHMPLLSGINGQLTQQP